jgi:hypothetical protein
MDRTQIEALEKAMLEEHRRDMEALNRLKRFLPNGSPGTTKLTPIAQPTAPAHLLQDDTNDGAEDGDTVATLRGKVGELMASDPTHGWTGQRMLRNLQEIGFPLKARKPQNSVIVAMAHWVKRGYATVARKGSGRNPNIIKWIPGKPFPLEVGVSSDMQGFRDSL